MRHQTGFRLTNPAGALILALIIAACCASGRPCVVQNAEIVDRGYDQIDEKLRALGADVVRQED